MHSMEGQGGEDAPRDAAARGGMDVPPGHHTCGQTWVPGKVWSSACTGYVIVGVPSLATPHPSPHSPWDAGDHAGGCHPCSVTVPSLSPNHTDTHRGRAAPKGGGTECPRAQQAPSLKGPRAEGAAQGAGVAGPWGPCSASAPHQGPPQLLGQGRVLAGEVGMGSPRPGTGMATHIGALAPSQPQLWDAEQRQPCPCHCQHPWVPWGTCHAQACCLPG